MLDPTPADVEAVVQFIHKVAATKYHRAKKDLFLREAPELPEAATLLLTFYCWFCLFNSRFKFVDASRYFFLPTAQENRASFADFIRVVQHYENKRVTRNREGELCRFLATCDKLHKEFYLMLVSRDSIAALPMNEVQRTLDLDRFSTGQLYAQAIPLDVGFDDLSYPVGVRSLPRGDCTQVVLAKEPTGSYLYRLDEGRMVRTKSNEGLLRDIAYSTTPRFAIGGYLHKSTGILYPTGLAGSVGVFKTTLIANYIRPLVNNLSPFFRDNLLTCIDTSPVVTVESEKDWAEALKRVAGNAVHTNLLIYNEQTYRTGLSSYVEARLAHGVIDGLWVEGRTPAGFMVWFNGELQKCLYDFSGRENALLNNIALVRNKRINLYYVTIGKSIKHLIGKEIAWHTKTWRSLRLRGSSLFIEKCVFCGKTEYKHETRGMCTSCYHLLFHYFANSEKDVWIPPSPQKVRDRADNCWEPALLNAVNFQHQGYYIKANESGEWGFFADAEAMRTHTLWKEKLHEGKM